MKYPKSVKEHWNNVGGLRCVITDSPFSTLHHVHGGSVADAGFHTGVGKRGVGDALVIPLKAEYHIGDEGVDTIGVTTWERWYGEQMSHIQDVSEQLGYDLIRLHKRWEREAPPRG